MRKESLLRERRYFRYMDTFFNAIFISHISAYILRYSNILANDNTRIILTHPDSDYINANLVTVPEVDRRYIMTQGPLNVTAEHFWHMVWQEETKGIVMLNKTFESGKLKCFQYFPEAPGEQVIF